MTIIITIAVLVGTIKLLVLVWDFFMMVNRQFVRTRLDLLARYGGRGTWAVVTGGSDGIGLEFCKQLAKDGFNICMVSRTESKLKAAANELMIFRIETKIIVADFFDNSSMEFLNSIFE